MKDTGELEDRLAEGISRPQPQPPTKGQSPTIVLRQRNFLLLWIGEAISMLGDQFHMIALPWLVLQLTGNGLAMGTVLALAAVPRALFMLVGGAMTDRFSPRALMLCSNLARLVLVSLLSTLVLTGSIQLWMLYILALAFGLADAFFYPAQNAIVPRLVDQEQLQAGNALVQGTAQLTTFVGPVLAGVLITLLAQEQSPAMMVDQAVPGMTGIGLAFALDALTFLVSAATLSAMQLKSIVNTEEMAKDDGVMSSIHEGLTHVWNDISLRATFLLIAAMNFLIVGPFAIGIPVLANSRFPEGATAFGIINSGFGAGSLLGIVLAGALPKPASHRMGFLLVGLCSTLGILLALVGTTSSTVVAAIFTLGMGAADGYVMIMFITWLQARTPQAMLGRMMSLLMFSSMGLMPISLSIAGFFIDMNTTSTFIIAGILMATITLLSGLSPAIRNMGTAMAKE